MYEPAYQLGNKQFTSTEEILVNKYQDQMFEEHIEKHGNKLKEDYRKKITQIESYYSDIREQNTLKGLSKAELHQKVFETS